MGDAPQDRAVISTLVDEETAKRLDAMPHGDKGAFLFDAISEKLVGVHLRPLPKQVEKYRIAVATFVDEPTRLHLDKIPRGALAAFLRDAIAEKLALEPPLTAAEKKEKYQWQVTTVIDDKMRQHLDSIPRGYQATYIRLAVEEKLARGPVPEDDQEDLSNRRVTTYVSPRFKKLLVESLPPQGVSEWLREALREKLASDDEQNKIEEGEVR